MKTKYLVSLYTADHRAGDHVQVRSLQGQVPPALDIQGVCDAGQDGAQSVEAVHKYLGPADGQAHQFRALLAAADRVDISSETGALEQVDTDQQDHKEQDHVEIDI